MGRQIALTLAGRGVPVRLYDPAPDALTAARDRIAADAPQLVEEGFFSGPADAISERVTPVATLAEAVQGAWLVIECAPERLELKRALYGELSALTPRDVILATNSSSFRSRLLADATQHPSRLLNTHFYNLPWQRSGVELMTCGQTDPAVIDRVEAFLRDVGFVPVIVRGESTGFIYNRIWRAIKRESLRVVAEGLATPEEVDRLFCLAMGTQLGPFGLMDRVGLDVVADIERHYAAESGRPEDGPPAFLEEMVRAGRLGIKTGHGFYDYPDPPFTRPAWPPPEAAGIRPP
ncbi:MAG: 3-hydroxyacyl-CoA dehydrogenase family protein, partial [Sphaerobacter sp.]|nr:3-hydroxyacyl-CoA dehydrogenase family protein [Sphaerobacter sp.]